MIFLIASNFINTSIEGWFKVQVERPLDQALDLPVLHELMTALPQSHRAALDERKAVVRFVRLQGQAAILGVRAITPWKDVAHLPSGDVRYLVLTKPIDAKLLADMSRTNQLPLRWNIGTTGDTENGIRVKDVTGRVLGQVEWRRSSSGAKALRQIMPAVAIIVVTFLAMSGWLAWRLMAAHRALRKQVQLSRDAESEARSAAEQASKALVQAEAARQALAASADQVAAEERRHQEELRRNGRVIAEALERSMALLVTQLFETAAALEHSADDTMRTIDEQQRHVDTVTARARDTAGSAQAIAATIDDLTASIGAFTGTAYDIRESAASASGQSAAAHHANDPCPCLGACGITHRKRERATLDGIPGRACDSGRGPGCRVVTPCPCNCGRWGSGNTRRKGECSGR